MTSTSELHGHPDLPGVRVEGYSLALKDGRGGFVGDLASHAALEKILDNLSAEDRAHRDFDAARAFARRLIVVLERFLDDPSWNGVERIVVGGGLKDSPLGVQALEHVRLALRDDHRNVELRPLDNSSDDAALIGWVAMEPRLRKRDRFYAVDIGGTNVRVGTVELQHLGESAEPHVTGLDKWSHSEEDADQQVLVDWIIQSLHDLIGRSPPAEGDTVFVGISCPGIIGSDGFVSSGTQNLPGNWTRDGGVNLAAEIVRQLESDKRSVEAVMHNDAVVQGMSDAACMRDVHRWAIVTLGTGVGNASFTNVAS